MYIGANLFQSSPCPRARRYPVLPLRVQLYACVSILALPEGKALRGRRCCQRGGSVRFNPRLARGQGATRASWRPGCSSHCFNPRLARGQGATRSNRGARWHCGGFNPRLARGQGATKWRSTWRRCDHGFNPRLARGQGATYPPTIGSCPPCVSILALPEGKALQNEKPQA